MVKLTEEKFNTVEGVRSYSKPFSVLQNKLIVIYTKDGRKLGGFFRAKQTDKPQFQDLDFLFSVVDKNTIRIANFQGKKVMSVRKDCGPIFGQEELEINENCTGLLNLDKMRKSPSFNYKALQLSELSDTTKQTATFQLDEFEIYLILP